MPFPISSIELALSSVPAPRLKAEKGDWLGENAKPLLSSGGQESSFIPPVFTWQPVHLCGRWLNPGLKCSWRCHSTVCSTRTSTAAAWTGYQNMKHFHGTLYSQPSSTNARKQTFSKGNGSLESVRNESPCRDPSKQVSPVTVSWEQSFILTWKHLNPLPCLPPCSHCNLKMNLLRRTQNSTKAQISYNYYFHYNWSR